MSTQRERIIEALERQDAGRRWPTGNWRQRLLPGVCKHETVRCIHGDEINHSRFRRVRCMVCGRALRGPLSEPCFYTGKRHSSTPPPSHPEPKDHQ